MTRVAVRNAYKVFGRNPERAIELLRKGRTREQLQKEDKLVVAVQDASFEVAEGELFVVMGLSGSGKSTLVRMLNRLHDPTAGTVEVDGEDVVGMDARALRHLRTHKISMVFQHFALFPHRRVWENAAYGLEVRGMPEGERRERARKALETVGLEGWEDAHPHALSGGMQQRVGLARALATDADILLMDEPFSALDPLIRRDMQDLLAELQRSMRRTIVFITHDLNEAMRIGDRIAVMKDGEIVQIGTGSEIVAEPANDYVAEFVSDVDRSRVLTAEHVMLQPRAIAHASDAPRHVLGQLRELESNGIYVLDEDNRILGVARDDRLARAIKEGRQRVDEALVQQYAHVRPGAPLFNLSRLAAEDSVPIAVTDDDRRLLGVVSRPALLHGLAGSAESPDPDGDAREGGGAAADDAGAAAAAGGAADTDERIAGV